MILTQYLFVSSWAAWVQCRIVLATKLHLLKSLQSTTLNSSISGQLSLNLRVKHFWPSYVEEPKDWYQLSTYQHPASQFPISCFQNFSNLPGTTAPPLRLRRSLTQSFRTPGSLVSIELCNAIHPRSFPTFCHLFLRWSPMPTSETTMQQQIHTTTNQHPLKISRQIRQVSLHFKRARLCLLDRRFGHGSKGRLQTSPNYVEDPWWICS